MGGVAVTGCFPLFLCLVSSFLAIFCNLGSKRVDNSGLFEGISFFDLFFFMCSSMANRMLCFYVAINLSLATIE